MTEALPEIEKSADESHDDSPDALSQDYLGPQPQPE